MKHLTPEEESKIIEILTSYKNFIKSYEDLKEIEMTCIAMHDYSLTPYTFINGKRNIKAFISYIILSKIDGTKCYLWTPEKNTLLPTEHFFRCEKSSPEELQDHFLTTPIKLKYRLKFDFLFPLEK